MRDEFMLTRTELANLICLLDDKDMASVNTPTVLSTVPTEASLSQKISTLENETANAMNDNSTQFEILKLLRNIQAEFASMSTNKLNSPPSKLKKKARKTPDNPTFTRHITNMYCWTHGGCAHAGSTCNDKAPGHKNEATFDNKMDGSKAFCP